MRCIGIALSLRSTTRGFAEGWPLFLNPFFRVHRSMATQRPAFPTPPRSRGCRIIATDYCQLDHVRAESFAKKGNEARSQRGFLACGE